MARSFQSGTFGICRDGFVERRFCKIPCHGSSTRDLRMDVALDSVLNPLNIQFIAVVVLHIITVVIVIVFVTVVVITSLLWKI